MAEENNNFNNENEAGAIWIKQDRAGNPMLSVILNGENYTGFKNTEKTNEKAPDYDIVKYVDGKTQRVGAGWLGRTKKDNEKLNIRLEAGGETTYFTAVMRGGEVTAENSKRADMTIFKPTGADEIEAASQAAEADAADATSAPTQKTTPKSL